jgi:hypothetical protein
MKYLDILKEEIPVHDDQEKPKKRHQVVLQKVQKGSGRNSEIPENTYHDELQKVQKGVFTVFTVGEGSTFSEKKAQGYGCGGCGGKVYTKAEIWVSYMLPESAEWEQEHSLVMGWKCDQCGSEYQYIGGTKGAQITN